MCGENVGIVYIDEGARGSPPRVRGKPVARKIFARSGGITPACAGKTCGAGADAWHPEDHPRVCGENQLIDSTISVPAGSPPRVRGKHDKVRGRASHVGITPACAGKTN